MSSAFAQLMKLSQTQTAESEQAIQSQIESHRRQLEQRKREQEVKEKREKELEVKLRMKKLQDTMRAEERKKQQQEEEDKKRKERERKEEQIRMALKYGPKKATSNGRGRAGGGGDNDLEEKNGGSTLTREEKRERKFAAQLRKGVSSGSGSGASRRNTGHRNFASLPDGRTVRRLPGGAVDVTVVSNLADPKGSASSSSLPATTSPAGKPGQSTRERLASLPATLVKLNTVKRDLRTIDEILVDRAKAKNKVLDGDEAREFSDWFGKKKKEDHNVVKSASLSAAGTPERRQSPALQSSTSMSSSLNNHGGTLSASATASTLSTSSSLSTTALPPYKSKPTAPKPIPSTNGSSSFFKSINPKPTTLGNSRANPSSSKRTRSPSPTPAVKRRAIGASSNGNSSRPSNSAVSGASSSLASSSKPSISKSAAASSKPRRQSQADADDMDPLDISSTIWSLFGKDKQRYAALDRFSDEEEDLDMEADARSVLKEEARRWVALFFSLMFSVLWFGGRWVDGVL